MKTTKTLILAGLALAGAALAPQTSLAGGLFLYEIATPDPGLASAGSAAGAQGASTLFKNPAGMSLLAGPQLQSGLQLLYGSVEFSKDTAKTGPLLRNDGEGGNAIGALPGASLFVALPVSEKLTVGFGTFSYFGLAEKFDDDWAGRYYVQEATLLGMSLMPAASFKANDWLSIGAGLNAMYGYMDEKVAIRQVNYSDGQLKLKDGVWGFGANAGILITPRPGTRIGVTYVSPVKLDFKDAPSLHGLNPAGLGGLPRLQNPASLDIGITVPQSVMVGIYHELNSRWAIMADVGWQDWSEFGKVDVGVNSDNPTSFTTDLQYDDTWHGAAGVQYQASEKWTFTGGVAYDSSAVSDADRTLSLPIGEAYRFGVGALFRKSAKFDFGAAVEFAWTGDLPVSQSSTYRGTVSGEFQDVWFAFFTLNLNWHF